MLHKTSQEFSWFDWGDQAMISRLEHPDGFQNSALPQIKPRFHVPIMQDKPQNPILDNIRLLEANRRLKPESSRGPAPFPLELQIITEDLIRSRQAAEPNENDSLWAAEKILKVPPKNQLFSWDALRPGGQSASMSTPFLSEKDDLVYASAQYHVQPRLKDDKTDIIYVPQAEFFSSLKMTVLGTSSLYHIWDSKTERFVQAGLNEGERGFLLIDGKDEVVSNSVITRFLVIGTLLRRLEIMVTNLRNRSASGESTVHAFAHAISNVLDYLRTVLVDCPPTTNELQSGSVAMSHVWLQYAKYEEILTSLAALCGRNEHRSPSEYQSLEMAPTKILSRIYKYLDLHMTQQSSRETIAIFAYILTYSSQEYLRQVANSVGFGLQYPEMQERKSAHTDEEYTLDDEVEIIEEDIFERLDRINSDFPSFFPRELLNVLPAAQKSLILLKRAQPDHPLLSNSTARPEICWFWTQSEIEAAWSQSRVDNETESEPSKEKPLDMPQSSGIYKPELKGLEVFDMEPGTRQYQATIPSDTNPKTEVNNFIDSFPDRLPPITPSLPHLSSVVFSDLLRHALGLSSALLDYFVNHPGNLNFRSHLILLRDFLLITSPSFKSRLATALFSDKENYEADNQHRAVSLNMLRQRRQVAESTQPWAVGLSVALLEREIWPPVGADLSFFLRTVIVDSLDYPPNTLPKQIVNDASWRLGFAIRDLPTGLGRDKWLNPLHVEALDFLYMNYKPPHPLEILIPPHVLSKYQRLFTFLLRLMRVECALHAVHRMLRQTAIPIFPTLASARKLTFHFRFIAQSFMTALSGYVFDTVIGGNFDPFLSRLSKADSELERGEMFSDVFALAESHSDLLDDILSACLMRSGQRAAGDLLRQATEVVSEFAVVIGELSRQRMQEYEAAPLVDDLYVKFKGKMSTLVLKGLVDRSSSKSFAEQLLIEDSNLPGGAKALQHLLLRLDISDWWTL